MITLTNLTKRYGEHTVFQNVNYTFPGKGLVCLVGASGGGKTTLLNLIAGFDTQYEGELSAGGLSLAGMSPDELCAYRRGCVGFVFQNYHLLRGYTALENVLLAGGLAPGQTADTAAAAALLEHLGLGGKKDQRSETLSGGQKQRVAIARALMGDPRLILADEPTGALDRRTSAEIMELLREISRERLVVVITHDEKLLPFADEVLRIQDQTLVVERALPREPAAPLPPPEKGRPAGRARQAFKNFRVHLKRSLAVSVAISLGLTAFLLSLSFGNLTRQSIADFEQKNVAYNNGYIKGTDDGTVLAFLKEDPRIENIYYQYKLADVSLKLGGKTALLPEKLPLPKATEVFSYGVMPRQGRGEIALSPSLAKKLDADLPSLLGRELVLNVNGQDYTLVISGIYNAAYDDFFVSSDLERQFYAGLEGTDNVSISYDVSRFEDIVAVNNRLQLHKISAQNAAKEVFQLQKTFQSLQRLFLIISALVLTAALLLCTLLLWRLQRSRYREIGLLSALGFYRKEIRAVIRTENLLLSGLAAAVTALLLGLAAVVCGAVGFPLLLGAGQVLGCCAASFAAIALISAGASRRPVRTEPAEALRR